MTSRNRKADLTWLSFWLAGVVLFGCREIPESALPTIVPTAENLINPTTEPFIAAGVHTGETAKWPDYIPADIPVLAGEIDAVLEADSHIRIFYKNVSMDQVLEYLDLLESMGFALEYRVYVQEGFPDQTEEKIQRGDFDAVDITKGEFHMNITYGADPTYDIYTSGFREEAIAGTTLQWPSEIPESVPQPTNCILQTFATIETGTYHITCRKELENIEEAYIQLLLDSDFEEKNGTTIQNLVIETTVYENDEAVVIPLTGFSPTFFTIEVIQKIEPEPIVWPEVLVGSVPQPAQCEISSILPTSPGNFLISCSLADEDALPNYLSLLTEFGFEETLRMVGQDDEILSVTMENETAKVQMMSSGMDSNLMIDVKVGQP